MYIVGLPTVTVLIVSEEQFRGRAAESGLLIPKQFIQTVLTLLYWAYDDVTCEWDKLAACF